MALPLSYNWKNLMVRKVSTGFTVAGVAVVIFVFTALMGFVSGMRKTLSISGDPLNVIVLKQGATAESNSAVNSQELASLVQAPHQTALAAEYLTIAALPRRGDSSGNWANVPVRGVEASSLAVHDKVRIIDGEDWATFISGTGEYKVLVGKAAAAQYSVSSKPEHVNIGLTVGSRINLGFGGNTEFRVAGVFEAGGGIHESEIWAYGPHVKTVYNRAFFSSITVKVTPSEMTTWEEADPTDKKSGRTITKTAPRHVKELIDFAQGPAVGLTAFGEAEYFARQTETVAPFLILAYGLLVFMGIAAGFAVANNMFAMVAGRMREIAMLRAIGFSRRAVVICFVMESLMLAGLGGLVGCLAAIPLGLVQQDIIGGGNSFTSVVFRFDISPQILAVSMTLAVVLGLGGAVFPALRAGRTPVVTALRQA